MFKRHSGWTRAALLFVWLTLLGVPALGQSFYGSLIAVVKDDQEKVIPGATITLVNSATSERREGVTGDDGVYRFQTLVPGNYRLEVDLTGFQRYVRIRLKSMQAHPRRSFLKLGSLAETIQVTGVSSVLQTENAAVGILVGSRPVQELPLNGRNVLNLISLAPSVVPQGSSEGSLTGKNVFAAGNFQVGGGTANQSASYFDGVPVQDSAYGNIVVLTPSPESVAEFRVQTNNSSAEFGRFTGGVINMASRSGTNTYRGSLFEYHRNKALNSNTFFGERAGLDRPPFVQNNFGGALGGPLLKDKLFFFGNYEGYRNREGVLFRRTVPTVAMRQGDFSDYRNVATGAVVPIYDPWTQCGINNPGTGSYNGDCGVVPNRLQFPGNIVPASRISPIAQKLLAFPIYANPTVSGRWVPNNFERNVSTGGDNDQYNIRGDYNLRKNQRLSAATRAGNPATFRSTPTATVRPTEIHLTRALHYDAGDDCRHAHAQLVDGRRCAVWAPALGLRSHARQPRDKPCVQLRAADGTIRPDFGTQWNPGNGNDSKHRGRPEPGHRHRSDPGQRLYVFVHADAHQDFRQAHAEGGREHPAG
jgi:hypothetical protein